MKYLLLNIILISFLYAGYGQGTPAFERIGRGDGLSETVVTCMLKDHRGFMWFGTQHGLNKYDGYEFTVYYHNDSIAGSLPGDYIRCLAEDGNGDLWIGTDRAGLCRYDRRADRFERIPFDTASPVPLKGVSVLDINALDDGSLMIGADFGVFLYEPGSGMVSIAEWAQRFGMLGETVETILATDRFILAGTHKGLVKYDRTSGALQRYTHTPHDEKTISNNTVHCLMHDSRRRILAGTNAGLDLFDPVTGRFSRFPGSKSGSEGMAQSEIHAMEEDSHGNLWIGTFGSGLFRIDAGSGAAARFTPQGERSPAPGDDYIYSLMYDPAGMLWIGTYGDGIGKLEFTNMDFNRLEHEPGNPKSLPGSEVYAIHGRGRQLWFGTDRGLCRYDAAAGDFMHFRHDPENRGTLSSDEVYSVLQDSWGNVWAGTGRKGLNRLAAGSLNTFERILHVPGTGKGISSNEILCITEGSDSCIWIGTSRGVDILDSSGKVLLSWCKSKPFGMNEVFDILHAADGTIWAASGRGLARFDRSDSSLVIVEFTGMEEESPSVYSIAEDPGGNIWLGTENAGLVRLASDGSFIRSYTVRDVLPDNVIYALVFDAEGNLWISTNNGLAKIMRQEEMEKLTVVRYSKEQGQEVDAFNIGAGFRNGDGSLWFGSYRGVTWFRPEDVRGNTLIPPVCLTGFQLFFKPVPISPEGETPLTAHISEVESIVLDHHQNVLKFTFAALNYIQSNRNRYAFRMEGLEDDWNYSRNRGAQYLYVPPGNYTFRVMAANNHGLWNTEGVSLAITVKPPFTSTVWFYLLLGAGLVILVIAILHVRTYQLRKTKSMLEKEVKVRTSELQSTNVSLQNEIKERKKVEEALKKSEARFRQLIETMNEGFSVQDTDFNITYVNPRLCEMFGYKPGEVLGRQPFDFLDDSAPGNRAKFEKKNEELRRLGTIKPYELRWKRKDGSTFPAIVAPMPIVQKDGKFTGSVAVLTDISDLKNAEQQLRIKNRALNNALNDLKKAQSQLIDAEKMASLGQLTAGVAHEINNPINFISGNIKPLKRDLNDVLKILSAYDEIAGEPALREKFAKVEGMKKEAEYSLLLQEIGHLLEGIEEGSRRTSEIVKGLRYFSRVDEDELKTANVNDGLEATLLILGNRMKERIEVVKNYGDLPGIMCFPGQLNQVFMNVLTNAVEAIPEKGKIFITTRMKGDSVEISIKDTGRGIPKEIMGKLFEPFFTTKEVGQGTGLGLSISYGIIERHKGKIKIESEEGRGSEFIITLPANLKE